MAIGNVELMHECFPKHMGTAKNEKKNIEIDEEGEKSEYGKKHSGRKSLVQRFRFTIVLKYFNCFVPNIYCALVVALSKKTSTIQNGYRKWGTHA